jgi:hypothetical protein
MFFIIAHQKGFKCVLEAILERVCALGLLVDSLLYMPKKTL